MQVRKVWASFLVCLVNLGDDLLSWPETLETASGYAIPISRLYSEWNRGVAEMYTTDRPQSTTCGVRMRENRREMLLRAARLCASFTTALTVTGQRLPNSMEGGCFFAEQTSGGLGPDLKNRVYRTTTGNGSTDSLIHPILFRAARVYQLDRSEYPTFHFLPPGAAGGDGFASDSVVLNPGTKGLVAVSLTLLHVYQPAQSSGSEQTGLLALETIIGHEFAHIYQMRNNYIDRLSLGGGSKYIELHADYLSGWFMSKKNGLNIAALRPVADALFSRGDSAVGQPGHHGTKEERFAATLQGYLRGDLTDSPEGAAMNAIEYLRELTK